MPRLYACVVSSGDKTVLFSVAQKFAYHIELQDDGILFDVSGLENHIGIPSQIAGSILDELRANNLSGNVAVSHNAGSAILYARSRPGITVGLDTISESLPLDALKLDSDMLGVFRTLGIRNTRDLRAIPEGELIARYGLEFRKVIDLINERGRYILTPNLREKTVSWSYELDFPIADAERLIFILGRGLSRVFEQASQLGFSTEQMDIAFGLDDRSRKQYELKISFPSLDKAFWLKLVNLRIASDPPDAEIISLSLICHFTRPRTVQRGLYSSTKPEPESLLLTVGKIKKLVGDENVGVPALLNQRLSKAFTLDAEMLPVGKESKEIREPRPVLALNYFNPPLKAETVIRGGTLLYLRTRYFNGRVIKHGGVWKESSQWWNHLFWQICYWDVELENRSIYRLAKQGDDWFVTGEYD